MESENERSKRKNCNRGLISWKKIVKRRKGLREKIVIEDCLVGK